jgi:hypothetical protein
MTMGESGMAGMGDMGMRVPRNSLPMVGMQGKHDYIDMGGMFTVVKVRENLTSYEHDGNALVSDPELDVAMLEYKCKRIAPYSYRGRTVVLR